MAIMATSTDLSRFCSTCARAVGLDGAGSAYTYEHMVAVEIPLPWPYSMYDTPGVLPQELLDFRRMLVESYRQGNPLDAHSLAIAPDPAYSRPGFRRVISYRRPEGLFARFTQSEYLVPEDEVGPLCWALLVDHAHLDRYAAYLQPSTNVRDLMVCTHGTVDAACAKFGFPVYRQMRRMAEASDGQFRVWRVSHFGGHVFAPTLIDMPEFRYWGYVEQAEAELLAQRAGNPMNVRQCMRGWAGFQSPFLQAAERELFVRYGWPWLDYLKQGTILSEHNTTGGAEPAWADVRIDYRTPDGSEHGAYVGRVELSGTVETIHTTGDASTYAYPQYTVMKLTHIDN